MRSLGLISFFLASLFFSGTASAEGGNVYTFCAQPAGSSVYRCQSYPAPTGGGGPGGGVTPMPFSNSVNPWTYVPQTPALDDKYRKAMFDLMADGQSDKTRADLDDLKREIEAAGSTAGALDHFKKENLDRLLEATKNLVKASALPHPVPVFPITPPPGASAEDVKKVLFPIRKAEEARDPFQMAEELRDYANKISRTRPETKKYWQQATTGLYTNSDGILKDLPDAAPQIHFMTDRSSAEGRGLRNAYNQTLVTQSTLEGAYRAYCQQKGAEACGAASGAVGSSRSFLADLAVMAALSDNAFNEGQDGLGNQLMQKLDYLSRFSFSAAKSFVSEGDKFTHFVAVGLRHPVSTLGDMGVGILDAVTHLDQTSSAIKNYAKDHYNTLLYGTPEEAGKAFGEVSFQVVAALVIPETGLAKPALATLGVDSVAMGAIRAATIQTAINTATPVLMATGKLSAIAAAGVTNLSKVFPSAGREFLANYSAKIGANLEGAYSRMPASAEYSFVGDKMLGSFAKENPEEAAGLLANCSYASRAVPELLRSGKALDSGATIRFSAQGGEIPKVVLPPSDETFARVLPTKYVDAIRRGEGLLTEKGEFDEAFITAAEDLRNIHSAEEFIKRISLFQDKAGNIPFTPEQVRDWSIIEFKIKNVPDVNLRAPMGFKLNPDTGEIEKFRYFGWIYGGHTQGGAREWLINNDAALGGHIEVVNVRPVPK